MITVGVQGVNADLATLIRTIVIVIVLLGFVPFTGQWANPLELSARTWVFLVLSALATGASWICYFRAGIALVAAGVLILVARR